MKIAGRVKHVVVISQQFGQIVNFRSNSTCYRKTAELLRKQCCQKKAAKINPYIKILYYPKLSFSMRCKKLNKKELANR